MKRSLFIAAALLTILGASGLTWWWLARLPEPLYPDQRRVSYSFVVENGSNVGVADARLWVYAPLANMPTQHLLSIDASEAFAVVEDELGNTVLEFALDLIPPYGQRSVRVDAELAVAAEPNPWPAPRTDVFVQPQPGIESDHQDIAALAGQLDGADVVRSIREALVARLTPAPYDAIDRGALHALREGSGDCTEFAYLAVALARALGIPARAIDGYVVEGDAVLEAAGFHTWAEIWDGRTWRIVDAFFKDLPADGTRYVGKRIVPTDREAFSASFTRFRFQGEGITVRMN